MQTANRVVDDYSLLALNTAHACCASVFGQIARNGKGANAAAAAQTMLCDVVGAPLEQRLSEAAIRAKDKA